MKALIIEDEALIALLMADQLETVGWATKLAGSGTKAFERLAAEHFDLAIVDLGLPGERGPDLIRTIQTVAPSTRIIVCTGYSPGSEIAQSIPRGIPVLGKPCSEAEFLATVSSMMAGTAPRPHHPA